MDKGQMDPLIEGYFEYQRHVRRLSPRTITDMRCTLNYVIGLIEEGQLLWKLTYDEHLQWIERAREMGKSGKTLNKDISHVRGLLDYAWRSGRSQQNRLDGFMLKDASIRVPPRVLTMDEARRLIDSCQTETKYDRRNRLMVILLYGCGFRTAELCGLNYTDISIGKKEVLIRHGKGDIQRSIPVPDGVWVELLEYLAENKRQRGALFRTPVKKKRISSHDVCQVIKEVSKRADLEAVTARTLRHTFATHLMDQGVDIAVISVLMGHRSPRETGVYLHAFTHRKESAVELIAFEKGEE